MKNFIDFLKHTLEPEKELLGYELRICNVVDHTFKSVKCKSIRDAYRYVGCNIYDHTLEVTIYNLDTNYFIKIHDHTSSKSN